MGFYATQKIFHDEKKRNNFPTFLPFPRLSAPADDEDTPYLVKVPVPPDRVTLGDFKNVLNKPNCKYFFKSMDDDFGVVKEEITDDTLNLPCFNGRVVSW